LKSNACGNFAFLLENPLPRQVSEQWSQRVLRSTCIAIVEKVIELATSFFEAGQGITSSSLKILLPVGRNSLVTTSGSLVELIKQALLLAAPFSPPLKTGID